MRALPEGLQHLSLFSDGRSLKPSKMLKTYMVRTLKSETLMVGLKESNLSLTEGFAVDKSILLSKTFWIGVITALAPLFPPVQTWIIENPQAFAAIIGVIFIILRKVTHKPVTLLPK